MGSARRLASRMMMHGRRSLTCVALVVLSSRLALLAVLGSASCAKKAVPIVDADVPWEAVAAFDNEFNRVGLGGGPTPVTTRLSEILLARKIDFGMAGSRGTTLSVAANRAAEARCAIAAAARADKLEVAILFPVDGGWTVRDPSEVVCQ